MAHRAPDAAAVHLGIGAHMRRLSVAHRVARRSAATRSQKRDCCGLALSSRRQRGGHEIAIEVVERSGGGVPAQGSGQRPAPFSEALGPHPSGGAVSAGTAARPRTARCGSGPLPQAGLRRQRAVSGASCRGFHSVLPIYGRAAFCARAGGVPARTARCATCISMSRGRRPRGPHERGRQRKGHLRCSVPETRLPTR